MVKTAARLSRTGRSSNEVFAFDELAHDYDESFTTSTLGGRMRAAVWRWLDRAFNKGERILELGCGTGEDALHLAGRGLEIVALDRSEKMVEAARRKLERHGVSDRVQLARRSAEAWALDPDPFGGPFDGALSNFGALNCVDDLTPIASSLAASVRPSGRLVLVLMGPVVPWEWLWYGGRGELRTAFRRLRKGGALWRGIRIRYPGIREIRRTFAPAFAMRRKVAIGALLPPSYAEDWAKRHPRLVSCLDFLERRLERWPLVPALADHYLVELERV